MGGREVEVVVVVEEVSAAVGSLLLRFLRGTMCGVNVGRRRPVGKVGEAFAVRRSRRGTSAVPGTVPCKEFVRARFLVGSSISKKAGSRTKIRKVLLPTHFLWGWCCALQLHTH